MKKYILIFALLVIPTSALAEEKCKGPATLCQELLKLREQVKEKEKLVEEKTETVQKTEEVVREKAEYAEKTSEYARDKEIEAAQAQTEKKEETDTTARNILIAGMIATGLRVLYTLMKAWKGFFTTEKQKAGFKIAALSIGVLAFLLTNVGLGMSWVNSLILAGGGPGAIMVHEFTKLIPILTGKKTAAQVAEETANEEKPERTADGDSNFPGGLFG